MPLFEDIGYFYTKAKEKITSSFHSLWTSYYVQAFYQGFSAPQYSFNAIQTMWNASHELRNEVQSIVNLNGQYACKSFLFYLVYYRLVHPLLNQDEDDAFHYVTSTLDLTIYLAMAGYFLLFEMPYNFGQNVLHTLTIVDNAAVASPQSEIKSCECKDNFAGGHSFAFYAANRYGISTISYYMNERYPNGFGMAASFILESLSFGYPLVEYKLAAVKTCTKHRFLTLMRDNKLYFFWFGASFVSNMWSLNYLAKKITGADNIFFHDAIFSLLFDLYAMTAIARVEQFPGGGKPRIDILAFFKYLSETRPPQYLYQLLKKKYSFEEIAKSEGVGAYVVANDEYITQWLKSVKEKLIVLDQIQSTLWFSYAEWIAKPLITIPKEIKEYCQRGYWSSKLNLIEEFIHLAKETQLRRTVLNAVKASTQQTALLKDAKSVISRETDSDDEWEDNFVEVLKESGTTTPKCEPLEIKDQYFARKPSSNNIKDGWIEVEKDARLSRADSGLFRKHRRLNEAAQKLLEDMRGPKKNLIAVTGLITRRQPANLTPDHIFKRELKRL